MHIFRVITEYTCTSNISPFLLWNEGKSDPSSKQRLLCKDPSEWKAPQLEVPNIGQQNSLEQSTILAIPGRAQTVSIRINPMVKQACGLISFLKNTD